METQKDEIINLFYIEHLKVNKIAEKINVTSAYITKVIKTDSRYKKEKDFRKEKSREKRKKTKTILLNKKEKTKELKIIMLLYKNNIYKHLWNYRREKNLVMKIIENGIKVLLNITLRNIGTNLMNNLVVLMMYQNT